ncbi:MAG TPA: helix-turn-helix transcriptional regulator [bacterium]|nr:helix-turn-helix transcriptional regulator [bacterium]
MGKLLTILGSNIRRLRKRLNLTQEELASRVRRHPTYISGIERGVRNITINVLEDISTALEVEPTEIIQIEISQLEKNLNCSKNDIIKAVEAGFRAQVDVKGKLAELFLSRCLTDLEHEGVIEGYKWHDEDKLPDFSIKYRGRDYTLECKNVRSGEKMIVKDGYRIEVEKTRNSKDGSNTRSYGIDEFDLLAACTFNQTNEWTYLYAATFKLKRKKGEETLLKIMQPVPFKPGPTWRSSLEEAIRDIPDEA